MHETGHTAEEALDFKLKLLSKSKQSKIKSKVSIIKYIMTYHFQVHTELHKALDCQSSLPIHYHNQTVNTNTYSTVLIKVNMF